MKIYKGAKYLGRPKRIGKLGIVLKCNDISNIISEKEAIGRNDFEPIYEFEKKEDYKKNKEDSQ